MLGGSSLINGWDYPTYLLIAGGCILLALRNPYWMSSAVVKRVWIGAGIFGLLIVLSRLTFLPFYWHFIPQLTITNVRLVSQEQRSGLLKFIIIYGLFFWACLPLIVERILKFLPSHTRPSRSAVLVLANSVLLACALLYGSATERVLLLCMVWGLFLLYACYRESSESANAAYSFGLIFMAFAVLAGCEVVYIKDFYGHPLERQNTVFKFYYQAWILLSIGIPVLLYHIRQIQHHGVRMFELFWKPVLIVLCMISCCYPILATYEKTHRFRGHKQGGLLYIPTLNGISYIAYRDPYEYDALAWIQESLEDDVVILEATGAPYTFFGRVATTTGRSTVLGWGNHEALWRDQSWKTILKRTGDIKKIYETHEAHERHKKEMKITRFFVSFCVFRGQRKSDWVVTIFIILW